MAGIPRPVGDRVIVRAEESKDVLASGLFLPQASKKPQRCGEVVAVGPGYYNDKGTFIPTQLKPGDRVIFGAYAGTQISVEGEPYQLMREGDIVATVDPEVEIETDGFSRPRSSRSSYYR